MRSRHYDNDDDEYSKHSRGSNISIFILNDPMKEEKNQQLRRSFSELAAKHSQYVNDTNERINRIIERDNEEYSILENRHNNYVARTNRTINRLNNEIERYQDEQYQSSLDYNRLKKNYNEVLDEKYDLKSEVTQLKKNNEQKQNDYINLQNDYNNLQNSYNNFQNQSNATNYYLSNEYIKYKDAYEINMGKFYELDSQYRVLWDQRNALSQENSDLRKKNEELMQLLFQKEEELNELKQQFESNKNKVKKSHKEKINVKFVSMDSIIKGEIISCYDSDIFNDVEEKLLQKYPMYRGKANIYLQMEKK